MYSTIQGAPQPIVMTASDLGSYSPLSGSMMRVQSAPSLPGGSPGSYSRQAIATPGQSRDARIIEKDYYTMPRVGSITAPMGLGGSMNARPQMVERIVETPVAAVEYLSQPILTENVAVEYVSPAQTAVEYVSPVQTMVTDPYKYNVTAPQEEVRQLALSLAQERAQRQHLEAQLASVFAQMNGIVAELQNCKARLDKIDQPVADTPLRAATRLVEQRGNVQVNHASGHVMLVRPLKFEPRTTKDKPTAVFLDMNRAEAICKDLAELSNIFNCAMTIEGHTKGGESQFWQQLADNRARVVVDLMIEYGANPNLLRAQGKPGRLGKNEVRTEIFMDISNIRDERAAVMEVDVIQNGRVVERDLYQAGHLVERDRTSSVPIMERDVVTASGIVVEKDYYRRNTADRELVGLGGRVVEREHAENTSVTVGRPATVVRTASPMTVTRPVIYP